MGNYQTESNNTPQTCQPGRCFTPLTPEQKKENQHMDGLMKYPKGVTIDQVDKEFIKSFDSKQECEEFLNKTKDWGGLLRLVRHG